MSNRLIKQIGYTTFIINLVSLIFIYASPYIDVFSLYRVFILIICVPLILLVLPGIWLVGRVSVLPTLYTSIAAVAVVVVYWKFCVIPFSDGRSWAINIFGLVACILNIVTAVMTLFSYNYFPYRRRLIMAGITVLSVLGVIIISVFLFSYVGIVGVINFK